MQDEERALEWAHLGLRVVENVLDPSGTALSLTTHGGISQADFSAQLALIPRGVVNALAEAKKRHSHL